METPDSPRRPEPLPPVHDPTAAITLEIMKGLTRTVKPLARPEGEQMVVAYGWPIKGFALVGEVFFLGLMLWVALSEADPGRRERGLVCFACFLVLPLILHLEFFHTSIRFDVHGLQTKSPWRRNRTIPWEDITGITFDKKMQWYAISTTRYGTVRVYMWLSGIQSLLQELARRGFTIPEAELAFMKW
ncbi:MAG TPA: hypothetical protein VGO11_24175 [Chthoniobacteraceae bacterium]|jgi:hypothetical protein|nr:hypothetical protein [Chthoniobacteraceae bacterium]